MLKIAPNPDAAYEICTVFAPDCKHQLKGKLNYNASSSENEDDDEKGNERDSDKDDTDRINTLRSTINISVRINIKQKKLIFLKSNINEKDL